MLQYFMNMWALWLFCSSLKYAYVLQTKKKSCLLVKNSTNILVVFKFNKIAL